MKKIMVLVAAASLLMACGGNSEKKALTVEEQAKAYCEKLAAATDEAEGKKILKEMEEWEKGLSEEDKAKVEKATKEWAEDNPEKFAKMMEADL